MRYDIWVITLIGLALLGGCSNYQYVKQTDWYQKQMPWMNEERRQFHDFPIRVGGYNSEVWVGVVKELPLEGLEDPQRAQSMMLVDAEQLVGVHRAHDSIVYILFCGIEDFGGVLPKVGETWAVSCTANAKGHRFIRSGQRFTTPD